MIYEPVDYAKRTGESKIRASHFCEFHSARRARHRAVQSAEGVPAAGRAAFLVGVAKLIEDIYLWNLSETAVMAFLSAIDDLGRRACWPT